MTLAANMKDVDGEAVVLLLQAADQRLGSGMLVVGGAASGNHDLMSSASQLHILQGFVYAKIATGGRQDAPEQLVRLRELAASLEYSRLPGWHRSTSATSVAIASAATPCSASSGGRARSSIAQRRFVIGRSSRELAPVFQRLLEAAASRQAAGQSAQRIGIVRGHKNRVPPVDKLRFVQIALARGRGESAKELRIVVTFAQ